MRRYSVERKNAVLKKLLPPENQSIPAVSASEGISEATLYNWVSKVRREGSAVPGSRPVCQPAATNHLIFACAPEIQTSILLRPVAEA